MDYLISAAAKKVPCHINSLIIMERKGLISPRRRYNRYRIFDEKDIEQIRSLLRGRKENK